MFCMSEVISSFKRVRAGLQVFAHLMLSLCAILHTIWLGKSLQLLCVLPFGFWYVVLVCHQHDVCTPFFGSVSVGGYGGLRKSLSESVFRDLCPVSFLVVGEGPLALL